jgi:hypothetical protein
MAVSARLKQLLLTLPDPHDARYPRPLKFRIVRMLAAIWWAPLILYLGLSLATLLALYARFGITALLDSALLVRAFRLEPLMPLLSQQPALILAVPVVSLVALLLAIQTECWALADRQREAEILVLRLVRPSEWGDTFWMQQALAPALEWRLRMLRRRRIVLIVTLLLVAVACGVVFAHATMPTFTSPIAL